MLFEEYATRKSLGVTLDCFKAPTWSQGQEIMGPPGYILCPFLNQRICIYEKIVMWRLAN